MITHGSETGCRLYYGTPLALARLDYVLMPDGTYQKALRPSIPQTYDSERRVFVPHSKVPVVCASLLPWVANFRALAHKDNHPHLEDRDRHHGWLCYGSEVILWATFALADSVREQGNALVSYRYELAASNPPWVQFSGQFHQFRSEVAVVPVGATEVRGERDWPSNVQLRASFQRI